MGAKTRMVNDSVARTATLGRLHRLLLVTAFVAMGCMEPGENVAVSASELVFTAPAIPASVGRTPVQVDVTDQGALVATTPILVPQGRLGAQPAISVAYSSGTADGAMGGL